MTYAEQEVIECCNGVPFIRSCTLGVERKKQFFEVTVFFFCGRCPESIAGQQAQLEMLTKGRAELRVGTPCPGTTKTARGMRRLQVVRRGATSRRDCDKY